MPELRVWILVGALIVGTATQSQAEISTFQNIIAARGGCINIHTINGHSDFFRDFRGRVFSEGKGTGITLFGKPVLKWSDKDVADAIRIYKDCWAKKIAMERGNRFLKAFSENQSAEFEKKLSEMVNDARNFESQRNAQERAKLELSKAQAQSERERAEEVSRSKQAQLAEQTRLDREAAEQARQLAEREAPKIAEAEKEAEDAKRLREGAEQKLAEVRDKVDTQIRARNEALARSQAAEVARQRENERQTELKEEETLSQPCKIKLRQFNEAQLGMGLREIERLFGCKGTQVSASRYSDSVIETYSWQGSTRPSSVTATFEDSLLKSKMQFGLE